MSVGTDYHLLSSYVGLLTLAVSIIYSGSYGSLPVRKVLTLMRQNLTGFPLFSFLLAFTSLFTV